MMHRQSAARFKQLVAKFPAIRVVVQREKGRYGHLPQYHHATVERVDPDTLFRFEQPARVLTREDGSTGRTMEYGYALGITGPSRELAFTAGRTAFFKDVLLEQRLNMIEALLWVQRTEWRLRGVVSPGPLNDIDVAYTVYLPPREGFAALLARADLTRTVTLSVPLIERLLRVQHPLAATLDCALTELAVSFEQRVCTPDLTERLAPSRAGVLHGSIGGVLLTHAIENGRLSLVLEAPNATHAQRPDTIAFTGNPPPHAPQLRVEALRTTLPRAIQLVNTFAERAS